MLGSLVTRLPPPSPHQHPQTGAPARAFKHYPQLPSWHSSRFNQVLGSPKTDRPPTEMATHLCPRWAEVVQWFAMRGSVPPIFPARPSSWSYGARQQLPVVSGARLSLQSVALHGTGSCVSRGLFRSLQTIFLPPNGPHPSLRPNHERQVSHQALAQHPHGAKDCHDNPCSKKPCVVCKRDHLTD